jgi:iron complex transport system ATP-binding protein
MNSSQYLAAINLTVHRGSRAVVKDLSFQMRIGELVGVLGANGAGKSSLLSALAGECNVKSGSVSINGGSLCTLSASEQAQVRAVLPQQSTLSFNLTVMAVVAMGAYSYPDAAPELVNCWVFASLNDTDLSHLVDASYPELSGGQQQRVQLARVLVQARAIAHFQGHAWILLDEPTASLDPRHEQLLMQQIHALTRAQNYGVMVIMHDLNLAALWCDRVMLLKEGTLIADDCPSKTFTDTNLLECFDMSMYVFPHPLCNGKVSVVASR